MQAKQYQRSFFVFRRDLRIVDNGGLRSALQQSIRVIPCFIIDPQQVNPKNNYRSVNALQFMLESLEDLDAQLRKHGSKVYIWYGNPADIIGALVKKHAIEAVFCNRDYTPFSKKRDAAIKAVCKQQSCSFVQHNDLLLTEPEEIVTGKGTPFAVFTPFLRKARTHPIMQPQRTLKYNFGTLSSTRALTIAHIKKKLKLKDNAMISVHGGRTRALRLLRSKKKLASLATYARDRNIPSIPTTQLSAHIKFGTVSIREVYHTYSNQLGLNHPLIDQLYWRDYYTHTIFHYPHVLGHACNHAYSKLAWSHNKKFFDAWCKGATGFPIIDAGMRQLNSTGFMHNRVRMLVASFLTKDLRIDWRWGERYFAQQLVDYDPAVNNGNWQWVASIGCCAMPYFRIFNPWTQQKKYDPDGEYIKEWVPELRSVQPRIIHTLHKHTAANYPRPIINHDQEAKTTKSWYRTTKK